MNVLVISGNYPSNVEPTRGTFVYNLVQEMCRQGARVVTIAPESIFSRRYHHVDSYGTELAEVRRPRYVSFSNKTVYPGLSTVILSVRSFTSAVLSVINRMDRPDVVYGHFLYPAGFAALRVAAQLGVPSVVALGESSMIRYERTIGVQSIRRDLRKFDHVITVSRMLRDYCAEQAGVNSEKISVIPNAVNTEVFHPKNRLEVRKKFGLPLDAFIVVYLGHFNERKGVTRVMAALRQHPDAKAIFLGNGPEKPSGEQVLFAGPVRHFEVPEWLAAGDIFVLPTLAEGDPNAVKEALAVGLPVVIGDIPPLREQFDERFAVFVDPRDVDRIAAAIGELKRDPERRKRMASEAVAFGQANTLSNRVERILNVLTALV